MTTAIQRRRGTTVEHSTFTGLNGEITVDTTKKTVVVHDGVTAGGFPLLKEVDITASVVPNVPAGNIAATNVQDALNELDAEKAKAGANTDITSINGTTIPSNKTLVVTTDIGASVQAYDVDTAKTDVEQMWTQVQRTNENVSTSLTVDLDAGYLDHRITPATGGALTFSNIPATPVVQKGTFWLVNNSNYAITAHADTLITGSDLGKLSTTGTYLCSYRTSNGKVGVVVSGKLA